MKKLKVVFSSAEQELPEGYTQVRGVGNSMIGNAPKWDFTVQDTFEGVLVNKRTATGQNGPFVVFECLHKINKKGYCLFGGKVLTDRLEAIDIPSMVCVKYKGKVKGKGGRLYSDFIIASKDGWQWNPADYPDFTGEIVNQIKANPPKQEEMQDEKKPAINKELAQKAGNVSTTTDEEFVDPPF